MAYVSLYRKYRPQTFADVVGQEHVTTTLRHAIEEGRVASGYLFCGTRGTAKTTCARILAKALNCIGPDGKRDKPNPEPCGVCGPCVSIAASAFVDVLEMDAASHGKVDDVRDLVASIKFPPMEGRFKVYIIDEAHQLSRDAMDAFLKTLEEPPDNVVFILATTEQDKLPITIASRCQVFEFKRGSVAQIAARLGEVLKAEGVKAQPSAVTLIARAADGSYRDSLSLLEQVLAFQRENITPADVATVLGTVDDDVLDRAVSLMAASDAAGAFTLAADVLEAGKDVRQFLKSLSARLRDLLFLSVGARPAGAGDMDDSPSLRAQASQFSPAALMDALQALTEAEQETKRNPQHRLLLEMTLLRLMRLPTAPAVQAVPAPAEPVGAGLAPPFVTSLAAITAPPAEKEQGEASPAPTSLLSAAPPDEDTLPEDTDLLDLDGALSGDLDLDTLDIDAPMEEAEPGLSLLDTPSLLVTSPAEHDAAEDFLQVQQVSATDAPLPEAPPPAPPADTPPELVQLQKSWQEVVNRMGSRSPSGVGLVKDAKPVALHGHAFTLQFTSRFFVDRMNGNERGRKTVEDIINKTLDAAPGTYTIRCILVGDGDSDEGREGLSARMKKTPPAPSAPQSAPPDAPAHSPLMDEVIAVFGGRVLDDQTDTAHSAKG